MGMKLNAIARRLGTTTRQLRWRLSRKGGSKCGDGGGGGDDEDTWEHSSDHSRPLSEQKSRRNLNLTSQQQQERKQQQQVRRQWLSRQQKGGPQTVEVEVDDVDFELGGTRKTSNTSGSGGSADDDLLFRMDSYDRRPADPPYPSRRRRSSVKSYASVMTDDAVMVGAEGEGPVAPCSSSSGRRGSVTSRRGSTAGRRGSTAGRRGSTASVGRRGSTASCGRRGSTASQGGRTARRRSSAISVEADMTAELAMMARMFAADFDDDDDSDSDSSLDDDSVDDGPASGGGGGDDDKGVVGGGGGGGGSSGGVGGVSSGAAASADTLVDPRQAVTEYNARAGDRNRWVSFGGGDDGEDDREGGTGTGAGAGAGAARSRAVGSETFQQRRVSALWCQGESARFDWIDFEVDDSDYDEEEEERGEERGGGNHPQEHFVQEDYGYDFDDETASITSFSEREEMPTLQPLQEEFEGEPHQHQPQPQRRVRFAPIAEDEIHDHVARSDMSPSEMCDCWYDDVDQEEMQVEVVRLVQLAQERRGCQDADGDQEEELCERGLEFVIDMELCEQREMSKVGLLDAVLDEQDRQYDSEYGCLYDPETLANVSRALSQGHAEKAAAAGVADEMAARSLRPKSRLSVVQFNLGVRREHIEAMRGSIAC